MKPLFLILSLLLAGCGNKCVQESEAAKQTEYCFYIAGHPLHDDLERFFECIGNLTDLGFKAENPEVELKAHKQIEVTVRLKK